MMLTQTGTIPIHANVLTSLYARTHGVLRRNVAEISHDESVRLPHPGGNCMNWVAGHIVATRDSILQMVGQKPRWTDEERKRYERGSSGIQHCQRRVAVGEDRRGPRRGGNRPAGRDRRAHA